MKNQLAIVGLSLVLLAGCAHTPRQGEVIMKAADTEAHVLLSAREVAVGDKVCIYRDVSLGGRRPSTEKKLIGEGTVTRLMGNKYASVEVPAGVDFHEGDYAERK